MSDLLKNLKNYWQIVVLFAVVVISSCMFANHSMQILSDRGREMIFPCAILNGEVPYKDILTIYFPLAYYINALLFKSFGISLNTVYITQTVYCLIFSCLFYFLSKEFFNKNFALILTILITQSCLYSQSVFGYILPYSYSMTYGLLAYLAVVYCLVKLFKTDNEKYLYSASFLSGAAVCFKAEFLTVCFLLLCTFLFYNKKGIAFYIKNLLLFFIMPLITLSVLFLSGVTTADLMSAINFGNIFSKTPSMIFFLKLSGMIPDFNNIFVRTSVSSVIGVFLLTLFTFFSVKISEKYNKKILYAFFGLIFFILLFLFSEPYFYAFFLPSALLILAMFNLKKLSEDKTVTLIVIAGMLISIRTFFGMKMNLYGTFAFPLEILAFLAVITKLYPCIKSLNTEKCLNFAAVLYLIFFTVMNISCQNFTTYPLTSSRGTVYLPESHSIPLQKTLDFIAKNTDKNSKILVLPEGSILNFLSDRKCDTRLHMLDRLYYDALGDVKSKELLEKTDNNYIIIAKGFNLSKFGYTDFYDEKNQVTDYISKNYQLLQTFENRENQIFILKNKNIKKQITWNLSPYTHQEKSKI